MLMSATAKRKPAPTPEPGVTVQIGTKTESLRARVATAEEKEEWEERVRPALASDAEVFLEVDHARKVELLRGAKAVLFPIDWPEPFGLVMAEAMACGTDRKSVV